MWLITVGWADASMVDFLVRSSSQVRSRLEIYHWFFSHIDDVILKFDYSPLDNLEGDLDLSPLFNTEIEHENLNIHRFEDFLHLELNEIEQFMRENGQAHGMVITVVEAQEQNYEIISAEDEASTTNIWKVTRNPRPLSCLPPSSLINLYDLQYQTRSHSLWKIRAREEHHVYQYILKHLSQFNIDDLPSLMKRSLDELIDMVQIPLVQTNHRFISEMINIQIGSAGELDEAYRYVILVEPALNLLDIIDI